jgi:hypothetical protein
MFVSLANNENQKNELQHIEICERGHSLGRLNPALPVCAPTVDPGLLFVDNNRCAVHIPITIKRIPI